MKWVKHSVRFLLVTAGIIVLTSLSIDATQYFSGSQSALGIFAQKVTEGGCPSGMTLVSQASGRYCIDMYEVSASAECDVTNPAHFTQTASNISDPACQAESVEEALPWRHVTFNQAKELCARAGKRLPTNLEWFEASLGTAEKGCFIEEDKVSEGGTAKECRSGAGAYDMIGNVWEWVEGTVDNGVYEGRDLPEEGYVQRVDDAGVAVESEATPNPLFGEDYFWQNNEGQYAMMRGGFYGSQSDAGIYATQAAIDTNFSGDAVGFRCVLDM